MSALNKNSTRNVKTAHFEDSDESDSDLDILDEEHGDIAAR